MLVIADLKLATKDPDDKKPTYPVNYSIYIINLYDTYLGERLLLYDIRSELAKLELKSTRSVGGVWSIRYWSMRKGVYFTNLEGPIYHKAEASM